MNKTETNQGGTYNHERTNNNPLTRRVDGATQVGDHMKDLSQLRSEHGMSQGKLAKASGISQSTISYIEKNKPNLNLDTIQKLAKGLGITVDYLLSE